MTEVHFYSGVANRLVMAQRVDHKAWQQAKWVIVYAEDIALLDELDHDWWQSPVTSFMPHARAGMGHAHATPIVLANTTEGLPHHDVLINLSAETPGFFSRFDRLVEIVSVNQTDRQTARRRWRFYQERGYALHNHNMAET
jgi:DNA polymerase-3 subunit chi